MVSIRSAQWRPAGPSGPFGENGDEKISENHEDLRDGEEDADLVGTGTENRIEVYIEIGRDVPHPTPYRQ